MAERRVCLGIVSGAHGVKGLVRIRAFTETPDGIAAYGPVTDETGSRRFELEIVGEARGQVLARIAGIGDRDAADGLKGTRLYVGREALPDTGGADEFYHADLIGLRAEDRDGNALGTVAAVLNYGAGDVLEIRGEEGDTRTVPFTRAAVPEVDIPGGRVVVDPPAEVE